MNPIKVLLIDDEPELLDISRHFLQMSKDLSVQTCDSGSEALEVLARAPFDVIVSDYQMARMDGLQLLRRLRESGNETRFILFTGKGREDVAVTALNLGATFYLQKGGDVRAQFAELANMIRRAAESARSERLLRESESKFRGYIENAPEGVAVADREGRYLEVNKAFCAMTGYGESELVGASLGLLDPNAPNENAPSRFLDLVAAGSGSHEGPYRRKDGSIRYWHIDAASLDDGRLIGFHIDVTQRKELIDDMLWRERMVEEVGIRTPLGLLMINNEADDLIYVSRRFYDLWGIPAPTGGVQAADNGGKKVLAACLERVSDKKAFCAALERRRSTEEESSEGEIGLIDGRVLRHIYTQVRDKDRKFIGRIHIFEDITQRHGEEYALRRRNVLLSILYEIISLGTKAPSVLRLAEEALDTVMRAMGFDMGGVYLVDQDARVAELIVSRGLDGDTRTRLARCPVDEPPFSKVLIEEKALFVEDTDNSAAGVKGLLSAVSLVSIPMVGRNGVIGCLNMALSVGRALSEEERSMLIAIGEELGTSVERRWEQERADREKSNLEAIFNSITDMVFVLDGSGNIIEANDMLCRRLGHRREDIIGRNVASLHGSEHSLDAGRLVAAIADGKQNRFTMTVKGHGGKTMQTETTISKGTWNGRECLIGSTRDITERMMADAQRRQSEEKFRLLVENAGEAVAVVQDGAIRYVNDSACKITGYAREDLMGLTVSDLACPEERESVAIGYSARQNGMAMPMQYTGRMVAKDGNIRVVDVKSAIVDWEGRPAVFSLYSDITDSRRKEEALRQANRQLNLMSSITRHDILNSVTVILGLLELARSEDAGLTPEMSRSLEKMRNHTRLIQSHVEFTRVYQDIGSQAPQWQGIGAVLARLPVPPGLRLQVRAEGFQVLADPMLEKVFSNLLDNTARHGMKATEVNLACHVSSLGMDIVYEDDGVGVPAEDKEKIFTYGHGRNTGLGLFLAREILSITHMRIRENGVEGRGARFEIHVPKGAYRRA
jgi:PAS domain S-box-containing protein